MGRMESRIVIFIVGRLIWDMLGGFECVRWLLFVFYQIAFVCFMAARNERERRCQVGARSMLSVGCGAISSSVRGVAENIRRTLSSVLKLQ